MINLNFSFLLGIQLSLMLPPLRLFIKQEARQAATRLLGNGCSDVPNFGHPEVLIKMTDEMPLLLAPRDKFVHIFGRKFSVKFHWMESFSLLMDLFARAELVRVGWWWRVLYIVFRRSFSTEHYKSALIVGLLCWPLNRMAYFPELCYSAGIHFRNWRCLTEFDWCGSLDTMISMGMRKPTQL
jgi:hypothetical protein